MTQTRGIPFFKVFPPSFVCCCWLLSVGAVEDGPNALSEGVLHLGSTTSSYFYWMFRGRS